MSSDRVTPEGGEPSPGTEALAGDRTPNQPDPQVDDDDRPPEKGVVTNDREEDGAHDDTTVDRDRDSPAIGVDKTSGEVPEPNEPG